MYDNNPLHLKSPLHFKEHLHLLFYFPFYVALWCGYKCLHLAEGANEAQQK